MVVGESVWLLVVGEIWFFLGRSRCCSPGTIRREYDVAVEPCES